MDDLQDLDDMMAEDCAADLEMECMPPAPIQSYNAMAPAAQSSYNNSSYDQGAMMGAYEPNISRSVGCAA